MGKVDALVKSLVLLSGFLMIAVFTLPREAGKR